MTTLIFDPDNTLAGALAEITPKEAIRLGAALCAAVEQAVGADGFHGGVWPGNITWAGGAAGIGPQNRASITDMDPDVLEFVSPEQFWSGESSPASDVYSIGLVLYTALNRGVKPYFQKAEDNGPEERAEALQKRMKGEALPYPAAAGRTLGDVVLRAVSFRTEERYATPGQLRAALEALPEGSDIPAVAPVVPLSASERQNAPSYRVDKSIEEPAQKRSKRSRRTSGASRLAALGLDDGEDSSKTEQVMRTLVSGHGAPSASEETHTPQAAEAAPAPAPEVPPEPVESAAKKKLLREPGEVDENIDVTEFREGKKRKTRFLLPALLVAVILIALFFLLRGCRNDDTPFPVVSDPVDTVTDNPIHSPVPETAIPGLATEPPEVTEVPVETDAPDATDEPAGTDAPSETDTPVREKYELVVADVTWTQARDLSERAGGHLVTVRSADQLQEIISMAEEAGVRFVWMGAYRDDNGEFRFVTGSLMDFAAWDDGEPSGSGSSGNSEDYVLLWNRPTANGWRFNDTINDPVSLLPRTYRGNIAYVIEYDD